MALFYLWKDISNEAKVISYKIIFSIHLFELICKLLANEKTRIIFKQHLLNNNF